MQAACPHCEQHPIIGNQATTHAGPVSGCEPSLLSTHLGTAPARSWAVAWSAGWEEGCRRPSCASWLATMLPGSGACQPRPSATTPPLRMHIE